MSFSAYGFFLRDCTTFPWFFFHDLVVPPVAVITLFSPWRADGGPIHFVIFFWPKNVAPFFQTGSLPLFNRPYYFFFLVDPDPRPACPCYPESLKLDSGLLVFSPSSIFLNLWMTFFYFANADPNNSWVGHQYSFSLFSQYEGFFSVFSGEPPPPMDRCAFSPKASSCTPNRLEVVPPPSCHSPPSPPKKLPTYLFPLFFPFSPPSLWFGLGSTIRSSELPSKDPQPGGLKLWFLVLFCQKSIL